MNTCPICGGEKPFFTQPVCAACEEKHVLKGLGVPLFQPSKGNKFCDKCGVYCNNGKFNDLCIKCYKESKRLAKPKFWLWDFRKRDLSYLSFGYGLFFGIGLCLGIHAAFTGNLASLSLSVLFFANSKYLHSEIPLSK